MFARRFLASALLVFLSAGTLLAADKGDDTAKLSKDQRRELIRALLAENVFIHRYFPMGQQGIKIVGGRVTPSDAEVRMMAAQTGTAAKPGDRAKITDVRFLSHGIILEINGGPVKKKAWYKRLEVSGMGGRPATAEGPGTVDETNLYTNAQGSYVLLDFKDYIPALTPDQVRVMLEPVFDFKAASVAEAYEHAMPPKIADAIKNHRALVGMDREMVTYAKGRPPRRIRDRDGETEYEEWIYGQPPQQVEFVRFVKDRVARIEVMEVDGQKVVRTQNEVGDLDAAMSAMAKKEDTKEEEPARAAPSILRPGETTVQASPGPRPTNTADQPGMPQKNPPLDRQPPVPGADQGPPMGPPGSPR